MNRVLPCLLCLLAPLSAVAAGRPIHFKRFAGAELRAGAVAGVAVGRAGELGLSADAPELEVPAERGVAARRVRQGTWTSPWVTPGFAFAELVPSWNAQTPDETWLEVQVQVRARGGEQSGWYALGRWSSGATPLPRSSVNDQEDALAKISTDTLVAKAPLVAYRLAVKLAGAKGRPSPTLQLLAAVTSDGPPAAPGPVSAPLLQKEVELAVPGLSQLVHQGHSPELAGGGEAWCSPTSTTMVLGFWKRGPTEAELARFDAAHPDRQVDYAAHATWDAAYGGTGNWAFNAAYAGRFGVEAFVTRLRSLAEAERFLRAGIPLIASISAEKNTLPGASWDALGSNGHLLVITGFTAAGEVIVNDPLSPNNAGVRHVYQREPFERAWMRKSLGTVYVIHPLSAPLPPTPRGELPNW